MSSLFLPVISSGRECSGKKSYSLASLIFRPFAKFAPLINALKTSLISGAGLDVYLDEPKVPNELFLLDNVTLLPHIGSATCETREAMGMLAVNNLKAHFFDGNYPSRII